MTTDNFCFYLQNRLIQTSHQEVNGTVILSPLVFPGESHSLPDVGDPSHPGRPGQGAALVVRPGPNVITLFAAVSYDRAFAPGKPFQPIGKAGAYPFRCSTLG